jgi:spore maturation protein CgeB
MHLAIFGLTISSSWGNGHATLWRGLVRAMARRGHTVAFYERDVPYYASTRDGWPPPAGVSVQLYESLGEIERKARCDLDAADLALCTSFCPDGPAVARLILNSRAAIKVFYDLDTPVTLDAVSAGESVPYLPPNGLSAFDLVLSFTGGKALDELQTRLGARAVAPLYGSVDPEAHFPVSPVEQFRGDLSYLGTYAADRQRALEKLFVEPARRLTQAWFQIAGAMYPDDFPWQPNIAFVRHLDPAQHPAFLCSSRATLNVTRRAMARYGYCPSGRLFEAAACGASILSDSWEGLEMFFTPGEEILRVQSADDVIAALSLSDAELHRIAEAAQTSVLEKHTAAQRVKELEAICEHIANGNEQIAIAS